MARAHRQEPSVRRAATRERLLDSALEVVARDGFHGATIHAIASHAGYSVGAVYSNFSGKDDLFFALFEERIRWAEFERDARALAEAGDRARLVTEWLRDVGSDPARFLAFVEFWAYAVRQPKIKRKLAARLREMRTALAGSIEAPRGRSTALSVDELALAMLALGRGLTLERVADPGAAPDETVVRIMAELFG